MGATFIIETDITNAANPNNHRLRTQSGLQKLINDKVDREEVEKKYTQHPNGEYVVFNFFGQLKVLFMRDFYGVYYD